MDPATRLNAVAVAALALAWLAAPAAAEKKTYQIVIDRPDRVGATYTAEINTISGGSQVFTLNDKVVQSEQTRETVALVAAGEVLAVDDEDEAAEVRYTVQQAAATEDGQPADFVKPGDVVVWRLAGDGAGREQTVTVNGRPPTEAKVTERLITAIGKGTDDGPDIDPADVFKTNEPRAVGETWEIDTELFIEAFKEKVPVTADDISGEVRLDSVQKVDGVEFLKVLGTITIDASNIDFAQIGGGAMPEGWANDEDSTIEFKVTAMVPSDPDRMDGGMALEMAMNIGVGGPVPEDEGGGDAKVIIKMGEVKATSIRATGGAASQAASQPASQPAESGD